MPPIWLCLDCEDLAYRWARGSCISCGSRRVAGTNRAAGSDESPSDHRLVFLSNRAWAQLEAEAILAGQSPTEVLGDREQREVVLICDEPAGHGQLILLKADFEKKHEL